MSARDRILARARSGAQQRREHPGSFRPAARGTEWADFAAAARQAGSEPLGPFPPGELARRVQERIERWGGGRLVAEPSAAEWLGAGPWETVLPDADPHSFADVAVAIARATLCVAENGALAIPPQHAPQRALLFLCERLIVIAPADAVVPDMHAAFVRAGDELGRGPCFTWMAGPSKTADIEQQLVIGAHGPRELAILGIAPTPEIGTGGTSP